jgi:hypothetical protein
MRPVSTEGREEGWMRRGGSHQYATVVANKKEKIRNRILPIAAGNLALTGRIMGNDHDINDAFKIAVSTMGLNNSDSSFRCLRMEVGLFVRDGEMPY